MAVRIRLSRQGRKKAPFYRLVVADSRSPRDGKFIELIGTYNPMTDPASVNINEERALYWLGVGALPSETARGLLINLRTTKQNNVVNNSFVNFIERLRNRLKTLLSEYKADKNFERRCRLLQFFNFI